MNWDGISNYWRIWGYLFPVLGILFIILSDSENKGKWLIANLFVSVVIVYSALN